MQGSVFVDSMAGRMTETYLPILLIKATAPEEKGLATSNLIKAREHDVYEVLEK